MSSVAESANQENVNAKFNYKPASCHCSLALQIANTMKQITINQEILLFAGTSFSRQEFCSKNTSSNGAANYSLIEELERACWAGMLCELLPELTTNPFSDCKMFIWNVLTAKHFLLVNQGTYPQPVESKTSVDPHLFLLSVHLN